jgi:hypothetical protein
LPLNAVSGYKSVMTAAFVGLPSADFPLHLAAKYRPQFKGLQKVADDLGVPMVASDE